jgi:hypothetical protein
VRGVPRLPDEARHFLGAAVPIVPSRVMRALGLEDVGTGSPEVGPPSPWGVDLPAPGPSGLPGVLARAGSQELGEALRLPAGDRSAAYRLLAADALVTWACEAAAGSPDPTMALEEVLDRIVDEGT